MFTCSWLTKVETFLYGTLSPKVNCTVLINKAQVSRPFHGISEIGCDGEHLIFCSRRLIDCTTLNRMPWSPGSFATVNSRTSIMRIWNVSQKQPLELVRIGLSGINDFVFLPSTERALCAFVDGSVGVYNLTKRQLEWLSNVRFISP